MLMRRSRQENRKPRSRRGFPRRATFPDSSTACRRGPYALHLHTTTIALSLHNGPLSAPYSGTLSGQAHSEIRLGAAQNPPGVSAGKEQLARALRRPGVVGGAQRHSYLRKAGCRHQRLPTSLARLRPDSKVHVTLDVAHAWEGRVRFSVAYVDILDAAHPATLSGSTNRSSVPMECKPRGEAQVRSSDAVDERPTSAAERLESWQNWPERRDIPSHRDQCAKGPPSSGTLWRTNHLCQLARLRSRKTERGSTLHASNGGEPSLD